MIQVRKHEVLEKIRQINDKLAKSYDTDQRNFAQIQERLLTLSDQIGKHQTKLEAIDTSKRQDLKEIDVNLAREVAKY